MNAVTNYDHWEISKDNNDVLWVGFDKADAKVNALNLETLNELEKIVDDIQDNKAKLNAVIFYSKKTTGFIAGADIEKFKEFKTKEEARSLIQYGQSVFDKIEKLSVTSVAMIEGFCLGGGLELALSCDYRVALDDQKQGEKKNIGLPEVMLGLHPGWGGLVRLPKLIGSIQALNLIMTGRSISSKTAQHIGIIDVAVPKRLLKNAVMHYALNKPPKHTASWLQALTNHKLLRPLIAAGARKKALKIADPNHYPAPYAALDSWLKFGVEHDAAIKGEADSLTQLAIGNTAQNLIRIFFLRERMKNLATAADFKVTNVHVIGAGTMGGDIAAWCALRGFNVTLEDQNELAIAAAIVRANQLFQKKLKKPRFIQAAQDRLQPDANGNGLRNADVIIEAISENLKAKQDLFSRVEKNMKQDAILATNTSSIPLDEINTVLQDPHRLVGMHFFNPVAQMQLVEVIHGKKTSQTILNKAMAFIKLIDRLPVPVVSSPGFLVNRVLMPYLMEAIALLKEGVPAEVIDKEMENFGMPMGPVELADTVGLDICLSVAKNLTEHFGGKVPERLQAMVDKKELGRKTGKGFYVYKNGKPLKSLPKDYKSSSHIAERLVMKMVHEAQACIDEAIIPDADLCDAAMVFGTGFAPFRGGPIHWASTLKLDEKNSRH